MGRQSSFVYVWLLLWYDVASVTIPCRVCSMMMILLSVSVTASAVCLIWYPVGVCVTVTIMLGCLLSDDFEFDVPATLADFVAHYGVFAEVCASYQYLILFGVLPYMAQGASISGAA
jgi:hypothetical protein